MFVLARLVTAVMTVVIMVTVAAGEDSGTVEINCQRCTCGQDGTVFSLHCQLTGDEVSGGLPGSVIRVG